MSALPKLTLSRMTLEEFLDWPGDGEPDGSWPANSISIAEAAPLALDSLDFSCPLAALYEGTRFIAAGAG
jgi:hypothetical protein